MKTPQQKKPAAVVTATKTNDFPPAIQRIVDSSPTRKEIQDKNKKSKIEELNGHLYVFGNNTQKHSFIGNGSDGLPRYLNEANKKQFEEFKTVLL